MITSLPTTRIAPGVYRAIGGRFTFERVNDQARAAGYLDGWHLMDDSDSQDPYVATFPTKREAVTHALGILRADELAAAKRVRIDMRRA